MAWTRHETGPRDDGRWSVLRIVTVLWIAACCGVIVMGLPHMYPKADQRLAYAFREPSMDLDKPFANCAQAHAAGFYDIPRASPAYDGGQDGDNDGIACEPGPGDPPPFLGRLKTIAKRLKPVT